MTAVLATTTSPIAGHPLWHFAVVAGGGLAAYAGIRIKETWQRPERGTNRLTGETILLSLLGLICAGTHAYVCPEHFHEWIVYGIFFMIASILQAAWSVLVLVRPTRRLILAGAVGNAAVVITFAISRTVGIPFGPDAFKPETFDALSATVTACETALIAIAAHMALDHRKPAPITA